MRIVLLMILALLAGCNSSDDDSSFATQQQVSAIPNEATAIEALRAQISTLQSQIGKLQIIGQAHGIASAERTLAIGQAAISASFGPCTDMGVQEGFASLIGDALSSISKAFHTCTGYHVEYMTVDGSIKPAPRVFFDGPNCTGNIIEWEAAGFGYDTQDLQDGIVFTDPSGQSQTPLYVPAHQTPQLIEIQSAWVTSNPGCQVDTEQQLMYVTAPNDITVTGVSNTSIGKFTTVAP